MAEKTLAAQFNRPGHDIVDHYTYVFMGDGCMMEGISHEACSLAGTLKLGKLIVFYDDNGISIDGEVGAWFSDDTVQRFQSYGWQVIPEVDGHNSDAIQQAIKAAKSEQEKPTLICCKTVIGFGSPNKEGKESCHGAPLGEEEIQAARQKLNWPHGAFEIPAEIYQAWSQKQAGAQKEQAWQQQFEHYQSAHPELAAEFSRRMQGKLPQSWSAQSQAYIQACQQKGEKIASRKASQNCLNEYGALLPELIGGSADLAGSNLTLWSGSKGINEAADGNYIYYGVREFAMSAISNGITLHQGFKAYSATFLVFMEYARNAVRMAALMKQPSIFVYTHDSIGLGEDGPTHQPVEQLANLRQTPNMSVWRPCDAVESAVAWKSALERKHGPTSLIFSRQGLATQARTESQLGNIEKGGYVLYDCADTPKIIIIATGSEVDLAMAAAQQLSASTAVRVVSMPSCDIFEQQDEAYKESVLPKNIVARIAVEAAIKDYWYKYVGFDGKIIGMESFGESAPINELYQHFSITVEAIVDAAEQLLS